jgi:hypothetical protein
MIASKPTTDQIERVMKMSERTLEFEEGKPIVKSVVTAIRDWQQTIGGAGRPSLDDDPGRLDVREGLDLTTFDAGSCN